jgi:type I restriction enzyme, S subunit
MGEFWKYPAPLPPLPEQRRIAAILDKADALRTKRRETLAQLDRLAQSIFVEMFGDPATNPKGFPRRKLGEIIKFEGGAQPPASTFSDYAGPDKIRLIQIRDFKSDRFKTFIPKALAKRFLEADDVMIGRYGPPVFQILRGLAGSYNVALMKAVPREGLTKEFVFRLLKEERLHQFVVANSERTAGQSGVNLGLLEEYDAYLPPMHLQELFGRQMSSLSSMQTHMSAALQAAETMFSSLQHRAFQGDL